MYWQIHTVTMLKEIAQNPQVSSMRKPIEILGKVLFAIADRARELNDPELNSLMCRLTLFSQSDPESADFDRDTLKLVHQFDAQLIKRIS